jgi:hypothetical protein
MPFLTLERQQHLLQREAYLDRRRRLPLLLQEAYSDPLQVCFEWNAIVSKIE